MSDKSFTYAYNVFTERERGVERGGRGEGERDR